MEGFRLAHRVSVGSPSDICVQILLGDPVRAVPKLAVTAITRCKLLTVFHGSPVLFLQLQSLAGIKPAFLITVAPVWLRRAARRQEACARSRREIVLRCVIGMVP